MSYDYSNGRPTRKLQEPGSATTFMHVCIDPTLKLALKAEADAVNISASAYVVTVLKRHIEAKAKRDAA